MRKRKSLLRRFTAVWLITGTVLLVLPAQEAESESGLKSADIDRMVQAVWQAKEIEPVGPAGDAEFLRRVCFDLVGLPPTYQEADSFLRSEDPDKRRKLVYDLLESERYGIHRASVLMKDIVEGRVLSRPLPQDSFRRFFQNSFNDDKPYDRLVRELISAHGDSGDNGATYLIVTHQANPEDLTGTVFRLFNGTQLRCVQCHDDKFGDWKQTDFWGTAAFFARTEIRPNKREGNRLLSVLVAEKNKGEMVIPEGGVTPNLRGLPKEERRAVRRKRLMAERHDAISPAFLGKPVNVGKRENRREVLAKLVTSPENEWFARTAVNRVWAEMFGKGLIEPVDDIYGKDAGDWEPLLQALAADFVRSGYHLKRLYAMIALSETYQRTSESASKTKGLESHFARARMRAHSPEVLLNTLLKMTHGDAVLRQRADKTGARRMRRRILEKFVFAFGNDEGNRVLSFEATIPQALMMMNDPLIERAISPFPGSILMEIAQQSQDPAERIRLLYLVALSREPSPQEMEDALSYLRAAFPSETGSNLMTMARTKTPFDGREIRNRPARSRNRGAEPYQDILWALMNTSEFLYNH